MVNAKIYITYDIATVDVGNTYVSIVYFLKEKQVLTKKFKTKYVRSKISIKKSRIIIVSSVVPRITKIIQSQYPLAKMVKVQDIPIKELPLNIGTDRALNIFTASKIYKKSDVLVVDFGSALTFSCCIDNKFVGGLIMPGVQLMKEALGKLAMLKVIDNIEKENILQFETEKAIKSGLYQMISGAVQNTIEEIKTETGRDFLVVATGGSVLTFAEDIDEINIINPTLIHEGLYLLANFQ